MGDKLIDLMICRSLYPLFSANTVKLLVVIIDHDLILHICIDQPPNPQCEIIRFYDIIGHFGRGSDGIDDSCLFI